MAKTKQESEPKAAEPEAEAFEDEPTIEPISATLRMLLDRIHADAEMQAERALATEAKERGYDKNHVRFDSHLQAWVIMPGARKAEEGG